MADEPTDTGESLESNGSIEKTYVEDEIKESYIDYAMSVIVGRALPDVRDGLKPVQRRILYAMHDLGLTHRSAHKKSARIVGEVLGKYHPHGDSAVYNTLVRMAQDFSLRYPLVDPQGNFGSVDGDNPAAMRYTEAKLDKISSEMLQNLDEDTVDFRPNFDDSLEEPKVLTSLLPNLLINGASGIAVGMATNIPPHQLGEVIDAIRHQIDNPDCSVDDLMEHIKGPDFPTGGLICSREGLEEMYKTGKGKIIVRGKVNVEEDHRGEPQLIIHEIPYRVNKAKMIEKIADRVNDEVIEGIRDIRDESDRNGMRVVVELKKGASPEVVENQLYQYTRLENTFGATMLALVDNEPEVLTLKEMIKHYISHRIEVIRRRTEYRLQKAKDRAHLLEGYRIAIANIDEVVEIIRESESPDKAKSTLMENYEVSDRQADAILRMQLQKLTSMEVDKIESEYNDLLEDIDYYETVLASEQKVREILSEELLELKEEYNDERRTGFSDKPLDISKEDLIEDEPTLLTLSREGYIKRSDPTKFRVQHRGGKGIYGADPKEGDSINDVFSAFTHDYLLVFTSRGICYWLKVYDVPEGGRRTQGIPIINLIDVQQDEMVRAVIPVRELNEGYLVMATKNGRIKKTDLEAFSRPRNGGIIGIKMPEDDELVDVRKTSGDQDIVMASRHGQAIRFDEADVRPTGRDTQGVKGIELESEDELGGLAVVQGEKDLLTVTEKGYGKRTAFEDYRPQTRGGKGLKNIKNVQDNGPVVAVETVDDEEELVLITNRGILLRTPCEEINQYGRNTQGVKIMNVMEEQRITGITLGTNDPVEPDDDESEDTTEPAESQTD
ncbi:MAG: DNA gyrase subunit A [bacterium]